MTKIDEIFLRPKKEISQDQIHFQVFSWYAQDFKVENNDEIIDGEIKEDLEYSIYMVGVDEKNNSVSVKVVGFNPYFYVEIPREFSQSDIERLYKYIKNRLYKESYGLVSYGVMLRGKIYPYLGGKKFRFMKLSFKTDKAFIKCKYMFTDTNQDRNPIKLTGIKNQIYEAFSHVSKTETAGWIKIKKYTDNIDNQGTQINITAQSSDIEGEYSTKKIASITILSYDLECLPENTEEFPNPELPGDIICQIGVVLCKYGTDKIQKILFTNRPCSPIEGAVIYVGENEKELLEKYCKMIKEVDPDKIIGYNTWGFDDNYLWKRLKLHNIDVSYFSRISEIEPSLKIKDLSSSAYGNNEFVYMYCPGRETFDMLAAIRRDHKLESYSLDAVSSALMGENKVDLKYSLLFKLLKDGTPDEIAQCGNYCIQDAYLPIKLYLKYNYLPNFVEMAKATFVPLEWLLFRGQQCKVFSLLAKKAREKKLVIPVYKQSGPSFNFKGATVLTANTGIYYEPVAGLDFASLYPSIIIGLNLCYSTYIAYEDTMKYVIENNIPYKTIAWDELCEEIKEPIHFSFSFVQYDDDKRNILKNGVRGILGEILLELWDGRKDTKKLMKAENDPFIKAIYNGKQLAQKTLMNSIYGFTGANKGILPCRPIAACTTATGRDMIKQTSQIAKEEYGAFVVYGDSIPGYEIITVKYKNDIIEPSIAEFADRLSIPWSEYRGFKVNDTEIKNKFCKDIHDSGYLTPTHEGYKPINKIIKHSSTKKLYKIMAEDDNGVIHSVTVTEGHSLIDKDGNLISADKLKIGDNLFKYQ
jgi:DNA polymerase delta subunit 1